MPSVIRKFKRIFKIQYIRLVQAIAINILNNFRRPQKKILIAGWLGAFNLGDEMMLHVSMKFFKKIHPKYNLSILVHRKNSEVIIRYAGHKTISRPGITNTKIRKLAAKYDTLFVNGGALLDPELYGRNIGFNNHVIMTLAYDLAQIANAFQEAGKDTIFYGVSSNNYIYDIRFMNDYKAIIEKSKYFSVRDRFSKETLSTFSDEKDIYIVDDIELADDDIEQLDSYGTEIVIIPIICNETVSAIKHLLDDIMNSTNLDIKIIIFYDEDYNAMKELLSGLGAQKKRIKNISLPKTSRQLVAALKNAHAVFSMRYHGTLVAGITGKKTICVNWDTHPHYHNKNKYLSEEYGIISDIINLSEITLMDTDMYVRRLLSKDMPNVMNNSLIRTRATHNLIETISAV